MTPRLLVVAAGTLLAVRAAADFDPWPRVIVQGTVTNTIYQPQLDSWDGFFMKARAVVTLQTAGDSESVYGVIELTAHTVVDKMQRTVQLYGLQITGARFPSAPDREPEYLDRLRRLIPAGPTTISLDRLEANLAILQQSQKARSVPVENTPPRIIFSDRPALLLRIDGLPVWGPVEGTRLQRVLNTRVLLLSDNAGHCYLHLWDGYLQATSLNGPWSVVRNATGDLLKAAALAADSDQVDLLTGDEDAEAQPPPSLKTTAPPLIYTATTPAELILFDGAPSWMPIEGTSLLYAANTSGDVFKELRDQRTYVLLSGRWFRAATFNGPWQYVPGSSLPPDFAGLPDTCPKENVKAAVPGTPQAEEMLIANSIPQTAEINRDAQLDPPPPIDGAPRLEPIPGTPLAYVVNSQTPIIRVDDQSWYACQDGVWFVAASPVGPWHVATSVPAVIYSIPPSCPIHYVTYVRISDVTPTAVYFGYTPGYLGSVVGPDGVVVYGTGYYYTPWVSTVYVSPPITYGYCAVPTWSPWAGWCYGFSIGWAGGWHGWAGRCRPPPPCWGPYWGYWHKGRHRNGHERDRVTAWDPNGWASTSDNIYRQWGDWRGLQRTDGDHDDWASRQPGGRYGRAYNSRTGVLAPGQTAEVKLIPGVSPIPHGRAGGPGVQTTFRSAQRKNLIVSPKAGNQAPGHVTVGNGRPAMPVLGNPGRGSGGYPPGSQVVAGKDGNIYRPNGRGGWQQFTPRGQWRNVPAPRGAQSLQLETQARDQGQQRVRTFDTYRGSPTVRPAGPARGNSQPSPPGGGQRSR